MSQYPTNDISSGWDNQNQGQRGFNSDPNNFSNVGGRGADSSYNDVNFSDSPSGRQQQQDFGDAGFGSAGGRGDGFNSGNRRDEFGSGGGRDAFAGNTTDINAPGAGGDFGATGRDGGLQHDVRSEHRGRDNFGDNNTGSGQNWDSSRGDQFGNSGNPSGMRDNDNWDDSNASGGAPGKASFGDRMKGTMETMAGKVTKNPGLVERGQERKEGFDNNNNY